MLDEDLAPLREPYSDQELPDWQDALLRRLGVALPSTQRLAQELIGDLDENAFGIAWWGGASIQRRILVSDQLVVCARSIITNTRDARLHRLEARHGWAEHAARFAAAGPGPQPQVLYPVPTTPVDDLSRLLAELHVAGFFRAVGSALDCLAATIVGVLALPIRILRTDLNEVRRRLAQLAQGTGASAEHVAFANWFDGTAKTVGPAGWIEWSLEMRNMLVHRGRRLEPVFVSPIAPALVFPAGARLRVQHLLPRDPGRQEIEVLRTTTNPFDAQLSEHADDTLDGVYKSLRELIEATMDRLLDTWRHRRGNPGRIPQPLHDQWPDVTAGPATGFGGYHPHSVQLPPAGVIALNPADARRLVAAAVDDANRQRWQTFP